jgi:catechol 2,3-dioxygenase-like lactoylglutathione lyase family enzyme
VITGVHTLIYSRDAEADRAFFRDVLGLHHIDVHDGWLIFALPPAELGVHPTDSTPQHELYLICDDLGATMAELSAKGVRFTGSPTKANFGLMTGIQLPGGGTLGIYEPRHETAI